jgi:hypothetical protein
MWSDDRPPLSDPVLSDEAYAGVLAAELPGFIAGARPGEVVVWPALERALDDLVDSVARDGARSVVVLAPSRLQAQPDDLARTAERSGTSPGDYDVTRPNRWIADGPGVAAYRSSICSPHSPLQRRAESISTS